MNLSLEGKYALICGSSQGIGLAIAEELALMGANCILFARNQEKLQQAVSNLDTTLRQVHSFYSVDFNNSSSLRMAVEKVVAEHPVHVLVNNTGGPPAGPIVHAKESDFLQAFQQHLIANHILATAVIDGMKKEGFGRIINIISTSVKIPLRNLGVSNTTRGAVASWAKTMSYELGQHNITVNNVLPGFTRTERLETIVQSTSDKKKKPVDEVEKEMMQEVPMNRFGEASEVAAVAAFLASPAASYVNGASIPVDGGRTGSI
jgi:3-oxoacyl-[acyl-carrier protein] reductase